MRDREYQITAYANGYLAGLEAAAVTVERYFGPCDRKLSAERNIKRVAQIWAGSLRTMKAERSRTFQAWGLAIWRKRRE